MDTETSRSSLTDSEGLIYTSIYGTLSAIDTTLSLIFVPRIVAWYEEEEAVRAEKDKLSKI